MKNLNFQEGQIKSGTKSVSEVTAIIQTTSTYGGFKLNNKAMVLLDLKAGEKGGIKGDRVIMFDMRYNRAGEQTGIAQEEGYFICKGGQEVNGVTQGAVIGATRCFQFSQPYGTIVLNDIDTPSIDVNGLVEKGLLEITSNNSRITNRTVTCDLVQYGDGEVQIESGDMVLMYKLDNFRYSEDLHDAELEEEVNKTDSELDQS